MQNQSLYFLMQSYQLDSFRVFMSGSLRGRLMARILNLHRSIKTILYVLTHSNV